MVEILEYEKIEDLVVGPKIISLIDVIVPIWIDLRPLDCYTAEFKNN